jgi:MYXO-CTERM domain-containing protein
VRPGEQSHAVVHCGVAVGAGVGAVLPPQASAKQASRAARDILSSIVDPRAAGDDYPLEMRWTLLCGLALLGACYGDPDRFNRKEATLLCDLQDKCDDFEFHLDEVPGQSCEDTREEQLASCTDVCEYDEDAAADCARALRKALRPGIGGPDCGLHDGALAICSLVYTECRPLPEEQLACEVPEPEFVGDCSVESDAPRSSALAWLGLVALLRYRRRRP